MGRKSFPRETRVCARLGCGKIFTARIDSKRKYCSAECRCKDRRPDHYRRKKRVYPSSPSTRPESAAFILNDIKTGLIDLTVEKFAKRVEDYFKALNRPY